ncbi:hypothetical protein HQQ94_09505 [Shewanella sp. VB17]|uniref:hypothetical protein n=1 Tax=Shewanella sp. VB17 TaxID=2739432 RepID=UPI001563EFE0|nr:hypothetical protein [Shewanella sp. VB17]NRD73476.1 hypothetical protein [Shewanella sp. VB17]
MANTLSGKIARLDGVSNESIQSNATSADTLFRYVGIIDRVVMIEVSHVTLTGYTTINEGERVLLSAQTNPVNRGVYQRIGADLQKVAHTIEDGNLVVDSVGSTDMTTVFWAFKAEDNSWTRLSISDGTVPVPT